MPQVILNYKSDLLNKGQEEIARWTGKKPAPSRETWSQRTSTKHSNVSRIPLGDTSSRKEDPIRQSWKEIVYMLNVTIAGIEARIRRLVELGDIHKARTIVSKFPGGVSSRIDRWRRLLAEPKVVQKTSGVDQDFKGNLAWIHHHANNYRGKWVALKDGKIIASSSSSIDLRAGLQEKGLLDGVLFFKVEG
jgi:hypothetical protein